VQDAERVQKALQVVAGRVELVGGSHVTHEDDAIVGDQGSASAQRRGWVAHVMQCLEGAHQVVASAQAWIACVPDLHGHTLGQSRFLDIASSRDYRRFIEVEPVDSSTPSPALRD
jgi:hypothetical protein